MNFSNEELRQILDNNPNVPRRWYTDAVPEKRMHVLVHGGEEFVVLSCTAIGSGHLEIEHWAKPQTGFPVKGMSGDAIGNLIGKRGGPVTGYIHFWLGWFVPNVSPAPSLPIMQELYKALLRERYTFQKVEFFRHKNPDYGVRFRINQ